MADEPAAGDRRDEGHRHRAGADADQHAPAQQQLPARGHEHREPAAGGDQDQRAGDHAAHAEPVHQRRGERGDHAEQHEVDRDRGRDRGPRPAELLVQRVDQHARDRAEAGRADERDERRPRRRAMPSAAASRAASEAAPPVSRQPASPTGRRDDEWPDRQYVQESGHGQTASRRRARTRRRSSATTWRSRRTVFGEATGRDGDPLYDVRVCGLDRSPVRVLAGYTIVPDHGAEILAEADTVIIPGTRLSGAAPRGHAAGRGRRRAGHGPAARAADVDLHRRVRARRRRACSTAGRRPRTGRTPRSSARLYPKVVARRGRAVRRRRRRADLGRARRGRGPVPARGALATTAARWPTASPATAWCRRGARAGSRSSSTGTCPSSDADGTAPTRAWALRRLHEPLGLAELAGARADERAHVLPAVPRGDRQSPGSWLTQQRIRARDAPAGDDRPGGGRRRGRGPGWAPEPRCASTCGPRSVSRRWPTGKRSARADVDSDKAGAALRPTVPTMRGMVMRRYCLSSLASLATVLTACSSDGGGEDASSLPDAAGLLDAAAKSTAAIKSAHFTLTVNGKVPGLDVQSAEGDLTREGGGAGAAKGTVKMTLLGSLFEGEFVMVDDKRLHQGPDRRVPGAARRADREPVRPGRDPRPEQRHRERAVQRAGPGDGGGRGHRRRRRPTG